MTREQATLVADTIEAALYKDELFWGWGFGSLGESEARVVRALTAPEVRTKGDVMLIAEQYGVRGRTFTPDYTLFEALGAYLEASDRQAINDTWRERRISMSIQ